MASVRSTPGRNDLCWCGSGKKYKKCHVNRESAKPESFGALRSDLSKEFRKKQCLHPLAGPVVCDRVIAAHTIQRGGALASIADAKHHVLSFYPPERDPRGQLKLRSVGWRDASTFAAFCAKHDDQTFAPIEKEPFTGAPQQTFLLAYRALCHELYQKEASSRSQPRLRDRIDRGRDKSTQRKMQEFYAVFGAGVAQGAEDARRLKKVADASLLANEYSDWSSAVIYFDGHLSVASTGAPTPTFDLDGNRLQVLHDMTANVEPLFYATVPTGSGGAVAFVWRREMDAPRRFVDSLLSQSRAELPDLLVEFMFTHVENTYFARTWWEGLSSLQRASIRKYAAIFNPYYDQPKYQSLSLVDWTVTEIQRS